MSQVTGTPASVLARPKSPVFAGLIALALGPIGYSYLGWQYALAGVLVFGPWVAAYGLIVQYPPWMIFAALVMFAVGGAWVAATRNVALAKGGEESADADRLSVAIYAMTSVLPVFAAGSGACVGVGNIMVEFQQAGILTGFGRITVLALYSFVLALMVAFAVDWVVGRLAPTAPRRLFPAFVRDLPAYEVPE